MHLDMGVHMCRHMYANTNTQNMNSHLIKYLKQSYSSKGYLIKQFRNIQKLLLLIKKNLLPIPFCAFVKKMTMTNIPNQWHSSPLWTFVTEHQETIYRNEQVTTNHISTCNLGLGDIVASVSSLHLGTSRHCLSRCCCAAIFSMINN